MKRWLFIAAAISMCMALIGISANEEMIAWAWIVISNVYVAAAVINKDKKDPQCWMGFNSPAPSSTKNMHSSKFSCKIESYVLYLQRKWSHMKNSGYTPGGTGGPNSNADDL